MSRGFTMVEMLLSIAVIALITAISIPVYQQFQTRNNLDITTSNVVQSLRRAMIFSQADKAGDWWSVRILPDQVVIYKGITFGLRDTSYDESIEIPKGITPSGMNNISFRRVSGVPFTTDLKPIVLTSYSNETRTITINEKGTISY